MNDLNSKPGTVHTVTIRYDPERYFKWATYIDGELLEVSSTRWGARYAARKWARNQRKQTEQFQIQI